MSHGGYGGHHQGGHYSHPGLMHGGQGHHGVTVGSLLGLGGHHSFFGHLLGLHGQNCHGTHTPQAGGPQDTLIWSSALQSQRLSDRFLNIQASSLLLPVILIAAMAGWLGLISWLRHHDPKASQIFWDASKAAQASPVSSQASTLHAQQPATQTGNGFGLPNPASAPEQFPAGASGQRLSPTTYGIPVQGAYGTRLRVMVTR